jgi:uncharacterized membrane protein (UPF0127 family)
MLKANLKKIKSARKNPKVRLAIRVALLLLVICAWLYIAMQSHTFRPGQRPRLVVGPKVYKLETVSNLQALEKGLSGRSSMPRDKGMLFDFGQDGQRCMWMKDMKFPLDIIWIASDKQVVAVQRNTAPSSYPLQYCYKATYVVELNAGETGVRLLPPGHQADLK